MGLRTPSVRLRTHHHLSARRHRSTGWSRPKRARYASATRPTPRRTWPRLQAEAEAHAEAATARLQAELERARESEAVAVAQAAAALAAQRQHAEFAAKAAEALRSGRGGPTPRLDALRATVRRHGRARPQVLHGRHRGGQLGRDLHLALSSLSHRANNTTKMYTIWVF